VRIVALGPEGRGVAVDAWGSTGVIIGLLARVGGPDGSAATVGRTGGGVGPTSVTVADFTAGGRIGRHPAASWQVFAVISGSGWVTGADDLRVPLGPGEAAVWEPGEPHESGTDGGMVVCIVEASVDPVAGLP
jgi:quercetin dioxygenase-like cupin family protein